MRRRSNRAGDWGMVTIIAIPAFAVLYAVIAFLWQVPNWVAAVYLGLSIACFAFYAADKEAANSGSRRTSEEKLLAIGLLGGWPGAILAQQLLRHKSIKASFRSAFWTSVGANVCAFVALSSPFVDAWSRLARAIG